MKYLRVRSWVLCFYTTYVYINDLISVITHSQPAAYVDDSQLHFTFSVSDSSSAMVNRKPGS